MCQDFRMNSFSHWQMWQLYETLVFDTVCPDAEHRPYSTQAIRVSTAVSWSTLFSLWNLTDTPGSSCQHWLGSGALLQCKVWSADLSNAENASLAWSLRPLTAWEDLDSVPCIFLKGVNVVQGWRTHTSAATFSNELWCVPCLDVWCRRVASNWLCRKLKPRNFSLTSFEKRSIRIQKG